jgi:hypothetical protein
MVHQDPLCGIGRPPEVAGIAGVERNVLQRLCYQICLPLALKIESGIELALDYLLPVLFCFAVPHDVDTDYVHWRAMYRYLSPGAVTVRAVIEETKGIGNKYCSMWFWSNHELRRRNYPHMCNLFELSIAYYRVKRPNRYERPSIHPSIQMTY